jgi:hypothetical protein
MHYFSVSSKGLASAVAIALGLGASSAMALQQVAPMSAASGGTEYNTTSNKALVPTNGTLTFFGLYSDDNANPESGLGLKVKYDGTKLTNVQITEEYQKCRIAAAQKQNDAAANAQVVMGWIDTSIRTAGAVGWPNTADTAGGVVTSVCLNPGSLNSGGDLSGTPAATSGTPLKLFKITAQWAGSPAVGAETQVDLISDGNYSYSGGTPGFTNKSFIVQAAAAPLCNLDVDNSGTRTAFVDGVLIVRHLLNLQGATLTNGVTITGTRNQPADLTNFMAGINWDMTGAGSQSAFRDGVILTRLMLGIPNTTLLNGVTIPPGATFQTAAAIRANVNSKCGTTF